MTYTYTLEVTPIWNQFDNILLSFVSIERQHKISRFVSDTDRKLSLYAALLTRMQLSLYTQIPHNRLSFSCTSQNKPFLLSVPNCHFNISHTKNRILLAISSTSVGADIESLSHAPLNVMDVVFHQNEIEYVHNATSYNDRNFRFFTLWTRKEALTKCLGFGLSHKPASFDTLSNEYLPHFHTWVEDRYMCSVYTKNILSPSHTIITEDEISSFFNVNRLAINK